MVNADRGIFSRFGVVIKGQGDSPDLLGSNHPSDQHELFTFQNAPELVS